MQQEPLIRQDSTGSLSQVHKIEAWKNSWLSKIFTWKRLDWGCSHCLQHYSQWPYPKPV